MIVIATNNSGKEETTHERRHHGKPEAALHETNPDEAQAIARYYGWSRFERSRRVGPLRFLHSHWRSTFNDSLPLSGIAEGMVYEDNAEATLHETNPDEA
jgi:hypothetical protein